MIKPTFNRLLPNVKTVIILLITIVLGSCDDDSTVDQPIEYLQEGFLIVATNDDQTSWFVKYFEELPSGTIDMTDGIAYRQFFPLSILNGAIYLDQTDASNGWERIGVTEDGSIVSSGTIVPNSSESFVLAVRDAEFGVFHDRNDPNIVNTFNPTTMAVTGTIDMSMAESLSEEPLRYQDFIFVDDKIFAPVREDLGGNVPDLAVPVIDIAAGAVTSIAEFEGLGSDVAFLNNSRSLIDESGNLYIWHTGSTFGSGSILKIPNGTTDYDPDYQFNVPTVNNPALGIGPFMTNFTYFENNVGFSLINESLDDRILAILAKYNFDLSQVTEEDFQLALDILNTAPTGAYVKVNVFDQSVEKINGLPPVSVYDNTGVNIIEGVPYFSISNENDNSFYAYDEETNTATKLFDVTGADLRQVIDLSVTWQ